MIYNDNLPFHNFYPSANFCQKEDSCGHQLNCVQGEAFYQFYEGMPASLRRVDYKLMVKMKWAPYFFSDTLKMFLVINVCKMCVD